jgi:hypothetical protein
MITGGAVSPDGRWVVLRTYADAFEFDVPGGDLVRAVTSGTPRAMPLPDEPQGESITYSPDGTALLTVSEATDQPADLLRYPLADRPATAAPTAAIPTTTAAAPPVTVAARRDRVPAGALLTGAVLIVAAAALGLAVARRRRNARR